MTYRELEPVPDLQEYVTCYWAFTVDDGPDQPPYEHVIMPDGCLSLAYARRPALNSDGLRLVGPRKDALRVPVFPGDVYWGIRFWPGTAGCLLHSDVRDFQERHLDAADPFPDLSRTLLAKLRASASAEAAAQTFDAVLQRRLPEATPPDETVVAGVAAIVAAQGQIRIGSLTERLGLSERQFQRRFQEAVGLTPKQFARIRRLRTSVSNILTDDPKAWGTVAFERGYADQPHLAREFSQLVGMPPTSFAERVRAIEHRNVTP